MTPNDTETQDTDSEESSVTTAQTCADHQQIADQIREFAETVDEPENWRIAVPVDRFDKVKAELDTTYDLGSYYNDISLVYNQSIDETRVEFKSGLTDYLAGVEA